MASDADPPGSGDDLSPDEERFRTILEHAPVMIDSFDARGHCLIWNRECERRLGWTKDELNDLTEPFRVFYPDAEVQRQVQQDVLRADGTFREYRVLAKDGSTRIQLWANFRTPRSQSIISVGHDVTRQRAIEAQLRQAQKMDAVGRLTGGIAHDFNNLLTIVLAGAELLQREVAAGSLSAELTGQILRAARDGSELVRQLGSFSRQARLSPAPVDLHALLDELAPTLRRVLPESIDVRVEHPRGPLYVHADLVAMRQILMNLATNARDAIEGRGTIELATRRVHESPRDVVVLSVRDSGHGMTPEVRDRVFEPFFTTKAPGKGTGLGLPTVYGLVMQHEGTVEVTSEPGVGTCIEITLPLTPAPEEGSSAADGIEAPASGHESILLVEDDEGARVIARTALSHLGYRVLVAEDGVEALAMLDSIPSVDLILSDVVMPRMTGHELLVAVRGRPGPMPAFAFCSGYADGDSTERLDAAVPLLTKPWSLPQLAAFVRACLDADV